MIYVYNTYRQPNRTHLFSSNIATIVVELDRPYS